ncbi:unnamed protein product [Brassica rapa subsp. narinosa]
MVLARKHKWIFNLVDKLHLSRGKPISSIFPFQVSLDASMMFFALIWSNKMSFHSHFQL